MNSFGKRLTVQKQMPEEGCGDKASRSYFDRTLSQSSVTDVWELPHLSVVSVHPVTHNDLCSVSVSWSPMQTCSIASVLCREPCCSSASWAQAVVCGRVSVLGWDYFNRKKKQKSFHPPKPKKPPSWHPSETRKKVPLLRYWVSSISCVELCMG